MFLKCPKSESLLEYVSIPEELSAFKRFSVRSHAKNCKACENKIEALQASWNKFFPPEVDITPSLLRVYSRLQNDETLILKGWKLSGASRRQNSHVLLREGWLFRGTVMAGLATLVAFVALNQWESPNEAVLAAPKRMQRVSTVPLAQIRTEENNRVHVHYVEPELLQSIEFETTGIAR